MATAAQRTAEFTSSLDYDDLPSDVVQATRLHILDALGCGLAANARGLAGEGRAVMAELGEGASSVIPLLALDLASVDALEEAVCTLDAQDDLRAVFSHLSIPKVAA